MPKKQENQLTKKQSLPGWRSGNRVKCLICSSSNSIRDCTRVDLQGSPIQGWYCNRCIDDEDDDTYIDDKKDKKGSGHKKDKKEKNDKKDNNPSKKTTTTKKTAKTGRTSSH